MGFWNFGFKNRKVSHTEEHGPGGVTHEKMVSTQPNQPENDARISSKANRRTSTQRQSSEKPKRLTKVDRSPFNDAANRSARRSATAPVASTNVKNQRHDRERGETFPTPPSNPFISPTEQLVQSDVYQHNPASQSSIGQELFTTGQMAPTLKAKRASQDAGFPRRKTSKRKAEDKDREHEIRAMTSPIPIPKRTSLPGGPLRRDTKRVPGDLNRNLQRPASDVSLPIPDSLESSIDGLPEHQHSFKVTAIDILSPRPTVRYTDNPRHRPSKSSRPSQTSTKTEKRPAIPEEDVKSTKRIEEIADSLGPGELRELMERDRRRKEKKQHVDRERLERRLQRRADRQRQQEQGETETGGPSNLVDGPSAAPVEPAGLGISSSAPQEVGETRKAEETLAAPQRQKEGQQTWLGDPSKENVAVEDPFTDEKAEKAELLVPPGPLPHERSFLRAESPMDVRMSQASIVTSSPPKSPAQRPRDRSSMSQMSGLARELTPDIPEHRQLSTSRRSSDQNGPQTSSWATFFKRGGTRRKSSSVARGKGPAPPSEFSNTSRDSFMRQGPPPTVPPRTFRKSGAPQRTQSKFREDLPDFPISPPDSRVQSPEADVPMVGRSLDRLTETSPRSISNIVAERGQHHEHGVHDEVTGFESPEVPPSAVLSQSLASVDSEASWLSGRPAKRNSTPMGHHVRSSSSLPEKPQQLEEEEDLANDEYLSRLTPGPETRHESESPARRASSAVLEPPGPSGEDPEVPPVPGSFLKDDDEETKWHGGVARQPTLIRQHGHIKSREGLLNEYNAGDSGESELDEEEITTPYSAREVEATSSPVFQASRIDYGKGHHARHISAGSAKLLDVRRTSIDSNRRLSSLGTPTTPRLGNEFQEHQPKS